MHSTHIHVDLNLPFIQHFAPSTSLKCLSYRTLLCGNVTFAYGSLCCNENPAVTLKYPLYWVAFCQPSSTAVEIIWVRAQPWPPTAVMEKDVCMEEKENVDGPPDLVKESDTGPSPYRYTKVCTFRLTTVAGADLFPPSHKISGPLLSFWLQRIRPCFA